MDQQRPLPDALEAAADAFERLRPRLFGIAYRVLGSVSEAEDVVQDVWVRWQGADRSTVLDQGAFLAKITTRLAVNVARSAGVRGEAYVGPWLPEPGGHVRHGGDELEELGGAHDAVRHAAAAHGVVLGGLGLVVHRASWSPRSRGCGRVAGDWSTPTIESTT
ncbi:hypothetical protein A4E84_03990 [Streptomyces qaidamensis]|uniref:RNA polymerase sigma-70 region 2 domain-containing protein n=1 Tax=Streptomyces qaidamensis TaxID=1783515 RepID=A0A143BUD0_9ACTN|nr:hypothetical protein A4E84_03990 [Streptomyces qaidamensis]